MGSDIFRELNMDDFAPSDVIYSMREQMTPSDDVVNSLLAKIAACETSPEFADNTVIFEPVSIPTSAVETAAKSVSRSAGRKPLSRKSLVGIASVAAACVIMLTSAVAIMGTGSPSDVDNLIDKIVPDGVVTDPADGGDTAADATDKGDAVTEDNGSKDGADATDSKDGKDSKDSAVTESDSKDKTDAATDSKSDSKNNSGTTDKNNNSRDDGGSTAPSPGNNSNTTVDKTGSGEATFNREILAEESVSHLTISGSNYVVESSSAAPVTTSEIKTISLEIPETSTTNEAVVDAHVKKIENVSTDLMVAVDVDGFGGTLIYTNEKYSASTLGEFVSDAGLDANTSYSKSVYCKGDNIGYSSYHKFSVSNIKDYVDKYILSNTSAKLASHSSYTNADTHVTFKSKSNPTCGSIDFGVSDNGYLYVKMASGKAFTFHIGTSAASEFISAITE